jgi:hypothetical protein
MCTFEQQWCLDDLQPVQGLHLTSLINQLKVKQPAAEDTSAAHNKRAAETAAAAAVLQHGGGNSQARLE